MNNSVRSTWVRQRELRGVAVGVIRIVTSLGWDYYRLNDPAKAQVAFVQARKAAESAGPVAAYYAAYFLGNFYASQGDTDRAIASYKDAISSEQDERFVKMQDVPATKAPSKGPSAGAAAYSEVPSEEKLKSRGFSFDPLPGTETEVQSIATLIRERKETADIRLGIEATKRKLLDTDLSQFRFLHFATHGVLAVDTGIQEPSLVLSVDGQDPSHMFLSMSEILGLKLQSESVVLSACNTGSGVISRAEGVMSLGRAFLAAGAESVTVSLWQVSDDSTVVFMKKYYEGLLSNKKKSVALAEARYAVFASGPKNPFYWAPFIVIGE